MATGYLSLKTPLDQRNTPRFQILQLSGEEQLNRNFSYTLEVSTPRALTGEEVKTLLGRSVTCTIAYPGKEAQQQRHLNGMVFEIREAGQYQTPFNGGCIFHYKLELSSWLRQLDYFQDCRIFQSDQNNCRIIIRTLLEELGYRHTLDFRFEIKKQLPALPYSVMYQETPFQYINRLLRQEGLCWYFEHSANRHQLVIIDNSTRCPLIPAEQLDRLAEIEQLCQDLNQQSVDALLGASYNWKNPHVTHVLQYVDQTKRRFQGFIYPGRFTHRNEGEVFLKKETAPLKSDLNLLEGRGNLRALATGQRFAPASEYSPLFVEKDYLIRRVQVEASLTEFHCNFTLQPGKTPFCEPLETVPQPKICGVQTALVVGRDNSSHIHTDRFGRIRVRFHWDRYPEEDATQTSAWIRMATPASGHGRGFMFTPQIGEEVVVAFEESDPDRPFVIGSVYNHWHQPPLSKGDIARFDTIKSQSAADSTVLKIGDQPGAEEISCRTKKDGHIRVNGEMTITVEGDLKIQAHHINQKARGNFINGNIITFAGKNIQNMARGDVHDLALLLQSNTAGGSLIQTAGGLIANTALFQIQQNSAGAMSNQSINIFQLALNTVEQTGQQITSKSPCQVNYAKNGMFNQSKKIANKSLIRINRAETENNSFEDKISTTTLMSQDEADGITVNE